MIDDRDDDRARGGDGDGGSVHAVDPEDEFWEAETYAGDEASAGDLDDHLYE